MTTTEQAINNAKLILMAAEPDHVRDKIAKAQVWALLALVKTIQAIDPDHEDNPVDLTGELP